MQLTLSRAEIAELTRTPQRRRQVEFLQRNGIRPIGHARNARNSLI